MCLPKNITNSIFFKQLNFPDSFTYYREKFLHQTLLLVSLFATISLFVSFARIYFVRWQNGFTYQLIGYIFIWSIYFFRRRISYTTKAYSLILSLLFVSTLGIWKLGYMSGSFTVFLLVPFFSSIFFDKKQAFVLTIIILGELLLFGYFFSVEILIYDITFKQYSYTFLAWFVKITNILFVIILIIFSVESLYRYLLHVSATIKMQNVKLEENTRQLASIIDRMPIAVGIANLDGQIEQLNKKHIETFGYNIEDVPTIDHWAEYAYPDKLYRKQSMQKWKTDINKTIETGQESSAEIYEITCKNGKKITTEITFKVADKKIIVTFYDVTQRINNEQKLKESQETLLQVIDNIPAMVFMKDANRKYLFANKRFIKVFRLQNQDIKGKTDLEIIDHKFATKYMHDDQIVISTSRTLVTEEEVPRGKDIRNYLTYKVPLKNDKNLVQNILGFALDITDRKYLQEKLKQREEHFRLMVESMPVLINAFDKHGYFIYWNKECERITGYSSDEIIGNPDALKLLYPDEDYRQEMIDKFEGKWHNVKGLEIDIVNKNGELKTIAWTNINSPAPIKEWDGWEVGIDVTDYKKILKELEQYKNSLETLVWERTNDLQAANEEMDATNEELYNKNELLLNINHELTEKQEEIQQLNEELKQTNEELHTTNESLHEQKYMVETALLQLKNTQTKLIQSEKMASLGVLTAGIAHEINNPINFISAGLQGLEDTINDILEIDTLYKLLEQNREITILNQIIVRKQEIEYQQTIEMLPVILTSIDTGIKRTIEIIRGLRLFSRLDEDEKKEIDLHENIDATLLLLRSKYKDNITIHKEYGSIPPILCYAGKINQVFMNLISNAIDAVLDKKQPTEMNNIYIKTYLTCNQTQVAVEISDTGNGIPNNYINRIFEPFFTTKEVGKGTGLGLSIVHGIVKQHDGNIKVENNSYGGATFTVNIPLS